MNAEHTKSLFEAGPILYSGRKLSLRENLMGFGFECGDGWYWPLMQLTENLEAINCLLKKYRIQVRAVQVKEKFGTLRFYYDVIIVPTWWQKITKSYFTSEQNAISRGIDNLVELMVDKAEDACMGYCENCGHAFYGDMRDRVETKGWISIICEKCAKEQHRNYDHFPNGKTWDQVCKDMEKEAEEKKAWDEKVKQEQARQEAVMATYDSKPSEEKKEEADKEKEWLDDGTGTSGEP